MFGFIKRKIKEFGESFSEQAHEEPAPDEKDSAARIEDSEAAGTTPQDEPSLHDTSDPQGGTARAAQASDASSSTESDTSDDPLLGRDEGDRSGHVSIRRDEPEPIREDERAAGSDESARADDVGSRPRAPDETSSSERSGGSFSKTEPSTGSESESAPPEPFEPVQRAREEDGEERAEREDARGDEERPRGFGSRLMGAFTKRSLSDEQFDRIFADLEIGLLEANTAYDAVQAIKENLRDQLTGQRVSRFSAGQDVSNALVASIAELFEEPEDLISLADEHEPLVIMLIGINGSGKTTTAAKLARAYQRAGKRPVLAAADTFRAAAIQQLETHAKALECRIIKHDYGADPTAVAYDALSHAKSGKADVVLIDTAGRLHSNENLLKELEKLKRIIEPHRVIFVGESIAGNDLIEQAETFNERIGIDGIILTKTDVDESGGGMLSVSYVTKKPIDYLGGGQGYEDLTPFSTAEVARLLGLER